MELYTAAGMKATEAAACGLGVSYEAMMQRAGQMAADLILRENNLVGRPCLVYCGRGNNGGDGYAAARRLLQCGVPAVAAAAGGPPKSAQALEMYRRALEAGVQVVDTEDPAVAELCRSAAVVVDALCGTGFSGELRPDVLQCCQQINQAPGRVYALDLPTGVCADDGRAAQGSVRAAVTVTFHGYKPGQLILPGRTCCGRVERADIGIPRQAEQPSAFFEYVERPYVQRRLPVRPQECNKGTFGRLLAVVGGASYMGAALLAAGAALRSGAGYVVLASTEKVCDILLPSVPECVMLHCPADEDGCISSRALPAILERAQASTAVLLGCGLGTGEGAAAVVRGLLQNSPVPVVLDADGINLAARDIEMLQKRRCKLILTPHPAEFARLLGRGTAEVLANRLELGQEFARRYDVTLLLKGSCTMVFTPDGVCRLADAGTPGLARAGSGDVLAGLIGGLAAQGFAPQDAAACGAWLHGRAGTLAAASRSVTAMLPRDVSASLSDAFLECGR